jgi:uncharacterized protein (TIGR02145 family)
MAVSIGACSVSRSGHAIHDKNGNRYQAMKMPDGKLWIMANINADVPGSSCYDSLERNCARYGRLYTWKTAMKVCGVLGEEWHLPSGDDWRTLARYYGGIYSESNNGKASYIALTEGGSAQFNALLSGGGGPTGNYWRIEAHGFYWTSTETNDSTAWFVNFGKGRPALFIQNGEKGDAFAVRCVKN